jgi:hypothetical protein
MTATGWRKRRVPTVPFTAKSYSNQAQIVSVFRAAGAYVCILGQPIDLLVGYKNHTILVQIKNAFDRPTSELQADFLNNWAGGTLAQIDGPQAALRILRVINSA